MTAPTPDAPAAACVSHTWSAHLERGHQCFWEAGSYRSPDGELLARRSQRTAARRAAVRVPG